MLTGVQMPDGWYPDPTGRHQHRRWEAGVWTDWVATNGQVGNEPIPPPPTGGGTLTSEPVIHTTGADGHWTLATPAGVTLAVATTDGRVATICTPSGTPVRQWQRSVAASTSVVSLVGLDNVEVGRFEEVRNSPAGGGFRVIGVGALLATIEAPAVPPNVLVLSDAGHRPLARISQDGTRWVTELAHPLGPPLGELAALAALAIILTWS